MSVLECFLERTPAEREWVAEYMSVLESAAPADVPTRESMASHFGRAGELIFDILQIKLELRRLPRETAEPPAWLRWVYDTIGLKLGPYHAGTSAGGADQYEEWKCHGCSAMHWSYWSKSWDLWFTHSQGCQYLAMLTALGLDEEHEFGRIARASGRTMFVLGEGWIR